MSFLLPTAIILDVIIKFKAINCKDIIGDIETISVSTLEHHYVRQYTEIVTLYANTE